MVIFAPLNVLLIAYVWCFLRSLFSYLSGRYHQAEMSAFTVQPRGRPECWEDSEGSAAVNQTSTTGGGEKGSDVLKSEYLVVF